MGLYNGVKSKKATKIKYTLDEGKVVIGKKRLSPLTMRIYGFIIQFLSGVLIVNSIVGIWQYKQIVCLLYMILGLIIFYLGCLYKRVSREAQDRMQHRAEIIENKKAVDFGGTRVS